MSIIFIICICMKHTRALCTLANSSNKSSTMSRHTKWMGENTYTYVLMYYKYIIYCQIRRHWNEMKHTCAIEIRISYNFVVGCFVLSRGEKNQASEATLITHEQKDEECWNKSHLFVWSVSLFHLYWLFFYFYVCWCRCFFCLYPTLYISRCVFCVSPVLCASLTFPFKYLAAIEMVTVCVSVCDFQIFQFWPMFTFQLNL